MMDFSKVKEYNRFFFFIFVLFGKLYSEYENRLEISSNSLADKHEKNLVFWDILYSPAIYLWNSLKFNERTNWSAIYSSTENIR